MAEQWNKVWFDGDKVVTQEIPLETIYKRGWVGLTDEAIWMEYQRIWRFHPGEEPTLAKDIAKFAHAIEAKLKEKNHG